MHFPDLKSYTFGDPTHQNIVKVVGWLNQEQPFTKGIVPASILDRLWELCKQPMGQGLRKNACQLCLPGTSLVVEHSGEEQDFNSWRLLLICSDQAAYLAPHVIFHYIVAHQYLPPQEFLEAVKIMPLPTTAPQAYFDTLERYHANLPDIERLYLQIAENTPLK